MEENFKTKLIDLVQNDTNKLIDDWLNFFDDEREKEIQHRYYADFLAFFEECVHENLLINSDSAEALGSFLDKLTIQMGEEYFYNFKNSIYTCYLKFPLFHAIEEIQMFNFHNIKPLTAFFESLTSKIILKNVQANRLTSDANAQELEEREAPLSEIWEGVLMLSIVGSLDSNRILKIIDKVLDRIESGTINHVIIDIGAIFDVNSEVSSQLLRLTSAVEYMGCEAYLSGINANIAKSLTHLDINMGKQATYRTTKQALSKIINAN